MLDGTDIEILEILKGDGRAAFSDIADRLDLATSTVATRVRKLEEEGVITGYRPEIDYETLGFELTAMIDVTAESGKVPEVAERLQENERVISFFEVTGETDMILISRFLDRQDMNSFIKSVQEVEGINSTETHVILTTPKLEDNIDLKQLQDRIE
jgi:DNA-binding Lrp family transcriptional regulator